MTTARPAPASDAAPPASRRPGCARCACRSPAQRAGACTPLEIDADRLWDWCRALAAMLAAGTAARGAPADVIDALLDLAP